MRRIAKLAAVFAILVLLALDLGFMARRAGLSSSASTALALAALASFSAATAALASRAWSSSYRGDRMRWAVALLGTVPAVVATLFFRSMVGLGRAATAILAIVVIVAVGRLNVMMAGTAIRRQVQRPITPHTIEAAEEMVEECRRQLANASLDTERRAVVTCNLVSALTMQSLLAGKSDGLIEATRLVEGLFARPPRNRWLLLDAADSLVVAMSLRADATGEMEGYAQAVQLKLDVAARLPDDSPALASALLDRSDYHLLLGSRAVRDGDVAQAWRHGDDAIHDLDSAATSAPARSSLRADVLAKRWLLTVAMGDDGDVAPDVVDRAVEEVRAAMRALRPWRSQDRELPCLALAELLVTRMELGSASPADDAAEVERLCRRLIGQNRLHVPAMQVVARALRLTEPPDSTRPGDAFRRAYLACADHSLPTASGVAADWMEWAVGVGNVEHAAEASRCQLDAAARLSRRQAFRSEREYHVSSVQGVAAEAAWWLLRAGRDRDAAVAIELGRAVLLSDVIQRERRDLERRLLDLGRPDLLRRLHDAADRLARVDQAEHGAPTMAAPMTRAIAFGGRSYRAAFTSAFQEAKAAHEGALREIGTVLGVDGRDPRPTFGDLSAVRGGPLVYVAAARNGGFALVVGVQPEPVVVQLPGLGAGEVRDRARRYVECSARERFRQVGPVLEWLWTSAMRPIIRVLPDDALVTLIPAGTLGLLPLHAAGVRMGMDGWQPPERGLTFRYAPNARVLAHAEALATAVEGAAPRVLTVDVPVAPGARMLRHAAAEAHGLVSGLGANAVHRLPGGRYDEVLAALDGHTVWHFACHGRSVPDRPLESGLLLSDRSLRLRDLLARRPGRHRLAVLSACETSAPGRDLLDEVISLPSGLLQTGVAGVVATQWQVDDRAAMLLVLRFFRRWWEGVPPPRALAEAQAWLRTSTNKDLHAGMPRQHPIPAGKTPAELADWAMARPFAHPFAWAAFSYTGA